jgi:integrase
MTSCCVGQFFSLPTAAPEGYDLTLPIVQAALGHASLATTDRYVRHVAPEELLEAMRTRIWSS